MRLRLALLFAAISLSANATPDYEISLNSRGNANCFAGLDSSALVPTAQLGTGAASSSTYLRGDRTWSTPAGGTEAFPVGSVFMAVVSTNPATLLGYGTWSAFGAGRVPVGLDSTQTEFDVVEETGGAKTHTLTSAEMPSHTHVQDAHNHTQNAHSHTVTSVGSAATGSTTNLTGASDTSSTTATAANTTATNIATTATNQNTGGGGAHNNLQPYIVVFLWKRIS